MLVLSNTELKPDIRVIFHDYLVKLSEDEKNKYAYLYGYTDGYYFSDYDDDDYYCDNNDYFREYLNSLNYSD